VGAELTKDNEVTKSTLGKKGRIMITYSDIGRLEEMTVQLEATLTQSSFGYEYAVLNLKKEVPFAHRQLLLDQMEEHKKVYFRAREMLGRIDPNKLTSVEEEIVRQKNVLLQDSEDENRSIYPANHSGTTLH